MRNLHTSRSSSSKETSASASASASSSARTTPYDRTHPMAPPSSRQQPQIATLAKRTPVTPKLATKPTATAASQRQTVTLATPVPRRSRPESVASQGPSSNIGLSATKRESLGREDYASPVSNFIQTNLTPRSDSRQSRASSANTSPNPADASADNWDRAGLGISSSTHDAETLRRNGPTSVSRDAKFFYASDAAKGPPPTSQPKPITAQQKGPTFFYANGTRPPLPPRAGSTVATSAPFSPPPPPLPASTPDLRDTKFMYANGTPDLKPSLMTSRSGSVVSTSSRAPSGRTANGPMSPALGAQRAPSPSKAFSHAHPSPHPPPPAAAAVAAAVAAPPPPSQPTGAPSIAERRSMLTSGPQLGQTIASSRRISSETPPRRTSGHSRSGSMLAEPPSATRVIISSPPASPPLPSPLSFNNPGLSMASVLQAADELAGDHDHDDNDYDNESLASDLASPKSASGNDPLNELVANARRERKVQDLQITNASLEAINRTLERQLRKQTNELRRYKRLSRAGRLSSANTVLPSRNVSDSTTGDTPEGPLNNLSLSDLSEEDFGEDEDLESELSESDSTGSAQTSPDGKAVREVRHRRRDEKRLQIDLSKHQQLLVDSQRMNQSLKRCLGWTEELISEGKRALAYQVRVSEVDTSGHFAPEEEEQPYIYDGAQLWDHDHPDQNNREERSEDSHTDEDDDDDPDRTMSLRIERLRPADQSDGNKNAQDRDSGIVLSGDGI